MSTPTLTLPASLRTDETGVYQFKDEAELSALDKQQLVADWQRFLASGFKRPYFTARLYEGLVNYGTLPPHRDRETFWRTFFAADLIRLKLLLAQFAGDRRSVETGTTAWLAEPAADLKAALCQEAARLYEPLSQVLDDLEYKHTELAQAWRSFALEAGLPDPGFPAPYQIGENSRNLLAYAAHIALHRPPPLTGLQYHFPPPLFYPEGDPG